MTNQCMALLIEELAADGIPDPLSADVTLAAVWDDLARLAGERPPATVRRRFERERDRSIVAHHPPCPSRQPDAGVASRPLRPGPCPTR